MASADCQEVEPDSDVAEVMEGGGAEGVASADIDPEAEEDVMMGLIIINVSESVGVASADRRARESDSDVTEVGRVVVVLDSATEERGVVGGVASAVTWDQSTISKPMEVASGGNIQINVCVGRERKSLPVVSAWFESWVLESDGVGGT